MSAGLLLPLDPWRLALLASCEAFLQVADKVLLDCILQICASNQLLWPLQVSGAEGQQQQADDEDMAAPMSFEDVEQEAAAKQRAYDSQQAKASTSGSSHEKGANFLHKLLALWAPVLPTSLQ